MRPLIFKIYMVHISFIMDGNRRHAKANEIEEKNQHDKWVDSLTSIMELCSEKAIDIISFWALSVDNIRKRSQMELTALYALIMHQMEEMLPQLQERNIRFEYMGDMSLLPDEVSEALDRTRRETQNNTGMTFLIGVAYDGTHEIVRATANAIRAWEDPDTLDEETFMTHVDSGRFEMPDLIVRTWANDRHRTSGWWPLAKRAEWRFVDTLWPDFGEEELEAALRQLEGVTQNGGA